MIKNIKNINFSPKIYINKPFLLNRQAIFIDIIFYALTLWVFSKSIAVSLISIPIIYIKCFVIHEYEFTPEELYSDSFIEFLNVVNSYLSIGMTFDNALLESIKQIHLKKYINLDPLKKSIALNEPLEKRLERLRQIFPIEEATIYSNMISSSFIIGTSLTKITNTTLEKMAHKNKIKSEIRQLLYQKRLEQKILAFAPVAIILMINSSSEDYLASLYTDVTGISLLALSFVIIVVMKEISNHLVKGN